MLLVKCAITDEDADRDGDVIEEPIVSICVQVLIFEDYFALCKCLIVFLKLGLRCGNE